jgi:starch phosphorylase
VHEYNARLYEPAHRGWERIVAGRFEEAKERAQWNSDVRDIWPQVHFVDLGTAPDGPVMSGKPIYVQAGLNLSSLKPNDVAVECVIGRIGASGGLEETEVIVLPHRNTTGDISVYGKDIVPTQTGRLGYSVRVSPNHNDDPMTRPVTSLIKWGAR